MMETEGGHEPTLRRREMLAAVGVAGLGLFWTNGCGWVDRSGAPVGEDSVASAPCALSPESTEGPFWVDNRLTRHDVTEGRPGVPLSLALAVEDASCRRLAKADVEIWHADASGDYSAVEGPGSSSLFLRGHQRTDASGTARFETIYPGWYPGRTPHVHLKVHVGGDEVFTGQLFFPDSLSRRVFRSAAYRRRGEADTTNATDGIYERGSLLRLMSAGGALRFVGKKTLVVPTR